MDEVLLVVGLLALVASRRAPTSSAKPAPSSPPPAAATVSPGDLLVPGASYHATIELVGIEAVFGTADAVKAKLEGAGFEGVAVTDNGGGRFDATGTWGGGAVPAKLPDQVKSVVRTS